MKVCFEDVGGIRTRYFRAGEGPALVLIHGVGYPADCFVRNLEALGQSHTVIAPDLLGQGFTAAPRSWTQAPQIMMADHIAQLLKQLRIDRCSIAGSSLGGLIAALYCHRHPETDNLIIIGSGTVFNDPAGQPKILGAVLANGSLALGDPTLANCRRRFKNTCYREVSADDVLLTQMIAYALPGAFENYKAIMSGLIETITDPAATVYPHLEKIKTRTLAIVGEKDIRTSFESHWNGARRMPNARVVGIPECGHLPFLESPDVFNDIILRFMSGENVGRRPS